MNPASIIQLVDAINELENVIIFCSYVFVHLIGFLAGLKFVQLFPS